jgi:hypothetical protein
MKILKKGNYFKAYCTEPNEGGTRFSVGDHMGSISIKTEDFVGATVCLSELCERLDKHKNDSNPTVILKNDDIINLTTYYEFITINTVDGVTHFLKKEDLLKLLKKSKLESTLLKTRRWITIK